MSTISAEHNTTHSNQPNQNGDQTNLKKRSNSEAEDEKGDDIKWNYLEHHGFFFPDAWKPHKTKILNNGTPIDLNPFQEEICTYWAQSLGTDWEHKDYYRDNFIEMFMKSINDKNPQPLKFENIDFTPICNYLERQKEERKNVTIEEKKAKKDRKDEMDNYYGYAMIDNYYEKITGYTIEAPTLFKGRGDHPKAGFLKTRIMPEDVIINISEEAPVPRCPMPGHAWKDVVHDNEVTWLASYRDDTIKRDNIKYLFLAANSKFKGQSDLKKYEKARNLKNFIVSIRAAYEKLLTEKYPYDRQIGTATY